MILTAETDFKPKVISYLSRISMSQKRSDVNLARTERRETPHGTSQQGTKTGSDLSTATTGQESRKKSNTKKELTFWSDSSLPQYRKETNMKRSAPMSSTANAGEPMEKKPAPSLPLSSPETSPRSVCRLPPTSDHGRTPLLPPAPELVSRDCLQTQRRVRFNDKVEICIDFNLPMRSWYSKAELSELKREAKLECREVWDKNDSDFDSVYPSLSETEIEQIAQTLAISEDFQHYRGVEHLISQRLCLARGLTVLNATTEILLEQVSTRHEFRDADYSRLANSYMASSLPASRYARIIGLADEEVAKHNDS